MSPPWSPEDTASVSYKTYSQSRKRAKSSHGSDSGSDAAQTFTYNAVQQQPQPQLQPDEQLMCWPTQHASAWPNQIYGGPQPVYQQYPQQAFMPIPYGGAYQPYTCYATQPYMMHAAAAPATAQVPEQAAAPAEAAPPPATREKAKPAIPAPQQESKQEANQEAKQAAPPAQSSNRWGGRSRAQVLEDDMAMAAREGVHTRPAGLKPGNAPFDALFWVVELDGSTTLRMFQTIDKELGPGRWDVDPRFNNAYFIREEAKKDDK